MRPRTPDRRSGVRRPAAGRLFGWGALPFVRVGAAQAHRTSAPARAPVGPLTRSASRGVLAASGEAFVAMGRDGLVLAWNAAAERTFGWGEDEVLGRRMDEILVPPAQRAAHRAGSRRYTETREARVLGRTLQMPALHRDGRELAVEMTIGEIEDGGAPLYFAFLRDVTEDRAGERRLADQLERLRSVAAPTTAPEAAPSPRPTDGDPVTPLLRTAREHLGLDVAWLSSIDDDRLRFDAIDGDEQALGGARAGDHMPLEAAYCSLMLDGRIPNVVADTSADPLTAELPPTLAGVTAYAGVSVVLADGSLHGTLCAASTKDDAGLQAADARFLHVLAKLAADGIDRERLRRDNQELTAELQAVEALLAALGARDAYTSEHSRTVVDLARAVAREVGADGPTTRAVAQVALLHDIGKVGIPDEILQKPGPLSPSEWDLMREHPAIGERIVAGIPALSHYAPAIRAEHERWDGGGYPDGLVGEAIPMASRIGLACDAWHAMRSDRPYRRALSFDAALAELARCAGSQFDPDVAAALRRVLVRGADAG